MAERYAEDGLLVLAVNAWDEPKKKVAKFVADKKLKHRVLLSGGKVSREYGVRGIPTTFWINRQGVIVDAELGFHGAASIEKKTEHLVKGGA